MTRMQIGFLRAAMLWLWLGFVRWLALAGFTALLLLALLLAFGK